MNGANSATNSAAGEISTAVSPDGTSCSPNVISMNGAATDTVPSTIAQPGRRRMSASAPRAAPRSAISSTSAASAVRPHTIIGALKSSSAYLISRYEPPQIAASAASRPIWRGVMTASVRSATAPSGNDDSAGGYKAV